jgi:RHH-type proline utilization regulon transcriptional repressor/proline dehydrogenase/delta 1-pyrroline-5-carboxylate dehydrogenase
VRDLVRSAFGHNGQKCSAASLAICEAEVYDDPAFRRQLRDAAASLAVGSAWEAASRATPLTQPPGPALRRALTTLDPGEEWLLEPRHLHRGAPLWSPGIKLGVQRGSFFHRTECFGPVLGLMRAADLDEAIALANDQPFGLTSGIQSLDDREVARWLEGIEAGNLYVNRSITGAIVGRQPFGGWKASSVGPGAKAGGPNYVLQLCRPSPVKPLPAHAPDVALKLAKVAYERAWREHFSAAHEPIRLLGERNVFRYRPCRRILIRGEAATAAGRLALEQAVLAARVCGTPVTVSLAAGAPPTFSLIPPRSSGPLTLPSPQGGEGGERPDPLEPSPLGGEGRVRGDDDASPRVESEAELITRLAGGGFERLRALVPVSAELRAAAHAAGVTVIDAPVLPAGRLELRHYLREQTVSHLVHRYGSVFDPLTLPSPQRGEGEG